MEHNRTQMRGAALLVLTALIWGMAFVAQSVGMDYLGPCAFNGVRSFIGGVALLPVIAFSKHLRKDAPEEAKPAGGKVRLWLWGSACGLLLGTASLLAAGRDADRLPGEGGVPHRPVYCDRPGAGDLFRKASRAEGVGWCGAGAFGGLLAQCEGKCRDRLPGICW